MQKLYFRVGYSDGEKTSLQAGWVADPFCKERFIKQTFYDRPFLFRTINLEPITVEVYENPDDTEPLFVGEIREVVTHEFSVKESK